MTTDERNLDEIRLAYASHADMQWVLARLDAAEARNAALREAGDSLAGYAETLLGAIENPVYRVDLVTFLGRWRALQPMLSREDETP